MEVARERRPYRFLVLGASVGNNVRAACTDAAETDALHRPLSSRLRRWRRRIPLLWLLGLPFIAYREGDHEVAGRGEPTTHAGRGNTERVSFPGSTSRVAAIRAALEAARKLKGHPESEVRDALQAELADRGVTDMTSEQLDPLVDAVLRGPRRAFLSATWSWLVDFRGLLREMGGEPLPSWTASPRYARKLDWGNTRSALHAIVELAPADPTIVDRIFDEVPDMLAGSEHSEDGGHRIFPCWVDVGPLDDSAGRLTVHVGEHVLGRLRAEDSVVVREILAMNGYTAVELNAVALEGNPRVIDVGVPDRA